MITKISFKFWYKWLLTVSIFLGLMGILIAVFPNSILLDHHTDAITETFFQGQLTADITKFRSFLFAPIGGTIAGYFLLQTLIVWRPFYQRQPWAWYAILLALLLWFFVDSTMSIYHGAFFNVWMINIWTLILIGIPLWMTRSEFAKSSYKN